jgi:hypothetical protein
MKRKEFCDMIQGSEFWLPSPEFEPRFGHVGFVVGEVALEQAFPVPILIPQQLPYSVICQQVMVLWSHLAH